jgi:hypothetical protein
MVVRILLRSTRAVGLGPTDNQQITIVIVELRGVFGVLVLAVQKCTILFSAYYIKSGFRTSLGLFLEATTTHSSPGLPFPQSIVDTGQINPNMSTQLESSVSSRADITFSPPHWAKEVSRVFPFTGEKNLPLTFTPFIGRSSR